MNQYISTIEHWKDGKAESWEQCPLETSQDITASNLCKTIKEQYGKAGYVLRVTGLFKL